MEREPAAVPSLLKRAKRPGASCNLLSSAGYSAISTASGSAGKQSASLVAPGASAPGALAAVRSLQRHVQGMRKHQQAAADAAVLMGKDGSASLSSVKEQTGRFYEVLTCEGISPQQQQRWNS